MSCKHDLAYISMRCFLQPPPRGHSKLINAVFPQLGVPVKSNKFSKRLALSQRKPKSLLHPSIFRCAVSPQDQKGVQKSCGKAQGSNSYAYRISRVVIRRILGKEDKRSQYASSVSKRYHECRPNTTFLVTAKIYKIPAYNACASGKSAHADQINAQVAYREARVNSH
jgi:hypothetical protein